MYFWRMKKLLFFSLLLAFTVGCGWDSSHGPNASNTNVSPKDKVDLTQFYEFYTLFHQDSLYQLSRINFPLEGEPSQQMNIPEGDKFYWQQEDWVMHKPVDFETSAFKRKITPLNDELVVEYIVHSKLGFGMMRRFAKLGNDWYLIYYAGMQPMIDAPNG